MRMILTQPTQILRRLVLFVSLPVLLASAAYAQREPNPLAVAGGCGICGSILLIPIAFIALNIALLVWVARDAKARGMDSAVIWMILVMFTSVIGLLIYILSRPQGNLIRCGRCGNNRLQASAQCPQCGNA
jgi:uncharacterized membrane protein YhaH (DUF805 family)